MVKQFPHHSRIQQWAQRTQLRQTSPQIGHNYNFTISSLSVGLFFVPWSTQTNSSFKRTSELGKEVFPWGRWDGVQCWAVQLSHELMPAGNSAKVCREMTLHLPGAAPATPPTDQGIWHRNVTAYCILYCVFLLGVLSSSSESQLQVTLQDEPQFSRREYSASMSCRWKLWVYHEKEWIFSH